MATSIEPYTTEEDIAWAAQGWLDDIAREAKRPLPAVPDGRRALVLVDLQRFFLDPDSKAYIPSSPAIAPQLRLAARLAAERGLPVAATRHAHREGEAAFPMDAVWRDLLMADDPLSELVTDIVPPGAERFTKSTYSAFVGTGLETWLRSRGVRVLIIAGVTTHLCVETTARHAFCLGFFPLVLADATAAWTLSQHLRALNGISSGIGTVGLTEKL